MTRFRELTINKRAGASPAAVHLLLITYNQKRIDNVYIRTFCFVRTLLENCFPLNVATYYAVIAQHFIDRTGRKHGREIPVSAQVNGPGAADVSHATPNDLDQNLNAHGALVYTIYSIPERFLRILKKWIIILRSINRDVQFFYYTSCRILPFRYFSTK